MKLMMLKNVNFLRAYLFILTRFKLKNDILIPQLEQVLNAQSQSLKYMLENAHLHFNEILYPFCKDYDYQSFKLRYHRDVLKRRPARFFSLLPATVWKNLKLSKMQSCGAQFTVVFIFIFMISIFLFLLFCLFKKLHLNLLNFMESL